MASDSTQNPGAGTPRRSGGFGRRAASTALRPMTDAFDLAVRLGVGAERHAVDRMLAGGELERMLTGTLNDPRIQAVLRRVLESEGARDLIDGFFDSRLFDHFVDRLLASDGLWRLVDEIAQSPSVMAALSQQGLGFAGQVGQAARDRSRKADDRFERVAERVRHPGRNRSGSSNQP
jgi:hypothetical protein